VTPKPQTPLILLGSRGFRKACLESCKKFITIRIRAKREAANCDPYKLETLMQPLLYFSYGMTKTGSTLAFQLVRSALDLCGFPQDRVPLDVVNRELQRNFVNHISPRQLDELKNEAKKRGYPIALKTHMRPDPCVVKAIQSGEAIAHACYRDPRDMALSMLDHGAHSRKTGGEEFAELTGLKDAFTNIRSQHDSLTAWLRLPNVMPLYFEDIAFNTAETARRILKQLKLKLDPDVLADVVKTQRFTQKNKAVPCRYPEEMDVDLSAAIATEFAPLIERFITNRSTLTGEIPLPAPQHLRLSARD